MVYLVKIAFLFIALLFSISSDAQLQLGLSANLGNRLSIQPSSGLMRPPSISGSLVLLQQKKLKNNWVIQYGGRAGVLGYGFKVRVNDTHFTDTYPFHDYSTVYTSVEFLIGRTIRLGNKQSVIGMGIGGTYFYTHLSPVGYSVAGYDQQDNLVRKFYGELAANNQLSGFVKIAIQMPLSERFTIGIHYQQHVNTIINGFYEFENTSNPTSGVIHLRPSEMSLVLLMRLKKV